MDSTPKDAKAVTSETEKTSISEPETAISSEEVNKSTKNNEPAPKTAVPDPSFSELLKTKDPASRKILVISMVSGILALLLLITMVAIIMTKRKHTDSDEGVSKEHKSVTTFKVELGEFHLILRPERKEGTEGEIRVDIVLESESKNVTDAILNKLPEVRDAIFPILLNLGRDDLLVPKNSAIIRKMIVDRMSTLSLPGKVTQAYFTNIIVE